MSHDVISETHMGIGPSGRTVIELSPELKKDLHAALTKDGITLKDWFIRQAHDYIEQRQQLSLALEISSPATAPTDKR